jgi:hypothetical protein
MLQESLAMSPHAIAELRRADRQRLREMERYERKLDGAKPRIDAAEAKRQRRRERNLQRSS